MDGRGCTLKCYFSLSAPYKPTREEMLHWLENKSGLSKDYFEKIVEVKYDTENISGLEITFHESVNCFIAIRQVKNRIVHGTHGACTIFMRCPKGSFEFLILQPTTVKLFSKTDIIDAIKIYGEIIDMHNVFWYDPSGSNKIMTGDIYAHILSKKNLPRALDISRVEVKIKQLSYKVYHDDKIMQDLWKNCKSDIAVDYSEKFDQMIDEKPGCKLICKFNDHFCFIPNETDVYGWLIKESNLSQENIKKILMLKKISEVEYHILFERSVNCLLVVKEMKNCKVYQSHGIYHIFSISCSKGKFVDVYLKAKNSQRVLTEKDIENVLNSYGIVAEYNEEISRCKFFMTKDIPKIITAEIEIVVMCCEQDLDDKVLRKVWNLIIDKSLVKFESTTSM